MKKVIVCLLLCLLFILLLGVRGGPGAGVTRCLLIGCDRFVTLMGTEPASANNVDTMEALLTDFLPGGTKISRQVNGPGTVEGFERLVEETFREANEEDIALIYLSTHGMLNEVRGQQQVYLLLSDGEEFAIELIGLCTDICVVSNALLLKAHFREAEISVDAACCAGVTPETHAAALQTMGCCQITVTNN